MKENNIEVFDNDFNIKKEFFKYLFFWKWFLISILISIFCAFIFLRYNHDVFKSTTKIKILDNSSSKLSLPSVESLVDNSKINLENEIEVLSSSPIIEKVIFDLNLTTSFFAEGEIVDFALVELPFKYIPLISANEIYDELEYSIEILDEKIKIYDRNNEITYEFKNSSTLKESHSLPFNIQISENYNDLVGKNFLIRFNDLKSTISNIKSNLSFDMIGRKSEILQIQYQSSNTSFSERLLNNLVYNFNLDGVNDRQLVHKRTIDFINERFVTLSFELDSIENEKKDYKLENNLIDIKANSNLSLTLKSKSNEELFYIENQISLANLLFESFNLDDIELLPANIGIENAEINNLVFQFNEYIIKYNELQQSAGANNPLSKSLLNNIKKTKNNIVFSTNTYIRQLKETRDRISLTNNDLKNDISKIPFKEMVLRNIERNQQIKESLYLFLLQKREEAEVSYAVTEPSIKVVEYASSDLMPFKPRKSLILLLSFVFGFLVPLIVLYLYFLFDNKIHSLEDIESSEYEGDVLGEIPFFEGENIDKLFNNPEDRSIVSESFRMVMSNVKYFLGENKSNTILVTSSIKGEGKTLTTLNLALSFASVNKKVLLIGCDLRNPQIHNYIGFDKNQPGLVDFLVNTNFDWKSAILKPFEKLQSLDILLSGPLPPNPLSLISNGNLDKLLHEAKKTYDLVIVDSAPTLLVADTKNIIKSCDLMLTIVRADFTDIDILSHISKIHKGSDFNNAILLNGIGQKNSYGYAYSYKYGYGYNYKYSYNYGYGYGYSSDEEKS